MVRPTNLFSVVSNGVSLVLTIELRVLVYYHCLPLLKSLFFPNKFQHGSGGAPAVLIMDGLITHHGYVNLQGGSTPGKNVLFTARYPQVSVLAS